MDGYQNAPESQQDLFAADTTPAGAYGVPLAVGGYGNGPYGVQIPVDSPAPYAPPEVASAYHNASAYGVPTEVPVFGGYVDDLTAPPSAYGNASAMIPSPYAVIPASAMDDDGTYDEVLSAQPDDGTYDEVLSAQPDDGTYDEVLAASPAANRGREMVTKDLPSVYSNEQHDASNFRGAASTWNRLSDTPGTQFNQVQTRYLSDAEQQQATLSVADGLLKDADGVIDTLGNSGVGTQHGLGARKDLFAMTPGGDVRATQAWENHREVATDPTRPNQKTLSMVNHSSLAAVDDGHGGREGGAVAAAGELQINQGKLEMLSDQSGHYKPDSTMTNQALTKFEDLGVDMHDVAVKLTPKVHGGYVKDSDDPDKKYLYASAREFMSHDGDEDAEKLMREQREDMKWDVEEAYDKRQARTANQPFVDPRAARDAAYLQSLKTPAEELFEGQY
jgi:hypothetical protein